MNKFDTKLFISEIQKRPAIWDTSSEQNADKEFKRKNWDEVINKFGEENMSPSDRNLLALALHKRWKNLRTCFARELKRQKNYGSGVGRKTEYLYYKNLVFLTDVMNIAEKDINEPEYVYYDDDMNDTTTPCQTAEYESSICKRNKPLCEEPFSESEENDDRLFLLSLHNTLKRVPRNKKMSVKIKMLSVLSEATE